MNSTVKIIIGIIVLVLVIWGISALVSNDSGTNGTNGTGAGSGSGTGVYGPGTIKIGFIGPLTGDAAAYGEPARNVVLLAVQEINDAGGIGGRTVQVIYEDGKCTGAAAASAMQKLVNVDKVQAVIDGICSSEALASIPVAESAKVVMISPGASSPDLTGKSKYFFRNYPSDATQGKVLADIAYNVKKWRKVAVIQEQSDYALGNYKAFSENFGKFGGKTIKEEFAPSTTDFKSILAKLKNENPDALFIDPQTPANGERILKQLQDLKWKPNLIINDALSGDPKTVAQNAALLEGAIAAEFGTDPTNPKFAALLKAYEKTYGVALPYQSYGQTIYDAVYLLRDGIIAVGYDGEKLATWSRTIKDWQGASGKITIESSGDRIGGHVAKYIRNGKVEIFPR